MWRVPVLTPAPWLGFARQLWGYDDFWQKCLATDVVQLKVGAQVRQALWRKAAPQS